MIGIVLTVTGTCPGVVDISVSGATPAGEVILFNGEPGGAQVIDQGACTGTQVDLAEPDLQQTMLADGFGNVSIQATPRAAVCGDEWQVLDMATCTMSNVVPVGCSLPDADADGFDGCSGDCDDADPLIHPAAVDVCGDGLDTNCSGADAGCAPAGSFQVSDGPIWADDPRVVSCVQACARLFSGDPGRYNCSTSDVVVDFSAFVSGWGDDTFCIQPAAQDFKLSPPGDRRYNCGTVGCSYSAFVFDHCFLMETNYCWLR